MSRHIAVPSPHLDTLEIGGPPPLLDSIAGLHRLTLPVQPHVYTPIVYDRDEGVFFAAEDPPARRYLVPAPIELARMEVEEHHGFVRVAELIGVEGIGCFSQPGVVDTFVANLGYHLAHGLEADIVWDNWRLGGSEWFHEQQAELRVALAEAARHTEPAAALEALTDLTQEYFHPGLDIQYRANAQLAMAVPANPLQQLWLEVIARVIDSSLAPRVCEHCGYPFAPRREGQRYCPDTRCADNAAKARRKRDPVYRAWEREYQRMYRRMRRGRLDEAGWETWKRDHPSPKRRER